MTGSPRGVYGRWVEQRGGGHTPTYKASVEGNHRIPWECTTPRSLSTQWGRRQLLGELAGHA